MKKIETSTKIEVNKIIEITTEIKKKEYDTFLKIMGYMKYSVLKK